MAVFQWQILPFFKRFHIRSLLRGLALVFTLLGCSFSFFIENSNAACGATPITWTAGAGSVQWGTSGNWNLNNVPDNSPGTEDAIVVSAFRNCRVTINTTVQCVDVQSGVLQSRTNRTLTIAGDYFKNPNLNGLDVNPTHIFWIEMNGAGNQSFENQDPINNFRVATSSAIVTLTQPFSIRNAFEITGSFVTIKIQDNLVLEDTGLVFTIPQNVTVELAAGKTLTVHGGIQINGTLNLKPGASLIMGSGTTLNVGTTGLLKLEGASGSTATVKGDGAVTYDFNILGALWANYFRIDNAGIGSSSPGVNLSGTLQKFDNGEVHFINNLSAGLTLQSTASIPATWTNVSFFDDSAFGNNVSINADLYTGTSTTISNWAGLGCAGNTQCANERDTNVKINWGAQAGTELSLSGVTPGGSPPATVNSGDPAQLFAIFSFSLNQPSTLTDITQITLTAAGTATSADIDFIRVYKAGASCQTQGTQIGSDLVMTGSPPTATISVPTGDITTDSSTNPGCVHVHLQTTPSAQNGNTVGIQIAATGDVTNSQGYSFSTTAGPPVSAPLATINGVAQRAWKGTTDTKWRRNTNWLNGGWPTNAVDCQIGAGSPNPILLLESNACLNTSLVSGGTINWNSTAFEVAAYGTLTVDSGYTFSNATAGALAMRGTSNQSFSIGTAFPGNLIIANTGIAPSNVVSLNGNSTINGNVTVTSGTLTIPDGKTLTVLGNVTVQTGAKLDIDPGGVLKLGPGSALTVNSGGTLELVGTVAKTSQVTTINSSSFMSITVNGTISARYYSLTGLQGSGLAVSAIATIDATNHLQNGSFLAPQNSTTFLSLYRQVPGADPELPSMTFDDAGNGATGVVSVYTDSGIAAGADLDLDMYAGNLSGPGTDNSSVTYPVAWAGATNTIDVTQEATSPATIGQGQTANMGRFGFKQTQTGASYVDTNLTSLTLTLTGTGNSSDITQVRAYYDSDCDSAAGTLIGSGTFTGSPAKITMSGISGAAIEAHLTSPPKRCVYIEYDIDSNAGSGNTVGVKLNSSTDFVNDQSYALNGSTPAPIDLGSPTVIQGSTVSWTGAVSTDWFNANNWNTLTVPTQNLNCIINDQANDPLIDGLSGTRVAKCSSVTIGTGIVTLTSSTGAILEAFGSLSNTGTLTLNDGALRFSDDGVTATNQTLSTTGNTLSKLTFNKTAGGTFKTVGSAFTISQTLQLGSGLTFEYQIDGTQTLTLPNGLIVSGGTFLVKQGGVLEIGNGQSILVNGGIFKTTGVNDGYPQSLSNKATIQPQGGSGSWGFSATSGSLDLTGFVFDSIDTNGLNLSGTTSLTNFNGGQFINLSPSYASVKAMQFNNTGSLPATASYVGWNWGPNNTPPASATAYTLGSSSGCNNQSISFDQWFGDFYSGVNDPNPETKVSDVPPACDIVISIASSPVSLLSFKGEAYDHTAHLTWVTGSETNHAGFNLYRSTSSNSNLTKLNDSLILALSFDPGFHGLYEFVDDGLKNDMTYYYYVEDVSSNLLMRKLHGPIAVRPTQNNGPLPPKSLIPSPKAPSTIPREPVSETPIAKAPLAPQTPLVQPGLIDATSRSLTLSEYETFGIPPIGQGDVIRIRYLKEGLYELRYEELQSQNLHTYLEGLPINEIRLYQYQDELPIEVLSSDSTFGPGDRIRFYANAAPTFEDSKSQLVLSNRKLTSNSPDETKRFETIDVDPTGFPISLQTLNWREITFEKNHFGLFRDPVASGKDHLYWGTLYGAGSSDPETPYLAMNGTLTLEGLLSDSDLDVTLEIDLKGSPGLIQNPKHHLGIRLNNVPYQVADAAFEGNEPTHVKLTIPASYFLSGDNQIRLQALGTYLPSGDWDIIYVNSIKVRYPQSLAATASPYQFRNEERNSVLTLTGFNSSEFLFAYDVSDSANPKILENFNSILETNGNTQIEFLTRTSLDDGQGFSYFFATSSQIQSVDEITYQESRNVVLKDPTNQADYLIIGPKALLSSTDSLADYRAGEGFNVKRIPVEAIYDEFTFGLKSSKSLKDFIQFTQENWQKPSPRYVFIIGDASYDSNDDLNYDRDQTIQPSYLSKGLVNDYSGDFWIAQSDSTQKPLVSIGRLPTNDPLKIEAFTQKIINYESGVSAPLQNSKKWTFLTDVNDYQEGFDLYANRLKGSALSLNTTLEATLLDREESSSNGEFKSLILNAFNEAPLLITYIGHGAEDQWADGSIFENPDADSLANSKLPFVLSLNCLNSYYYDPDPDLISLGEALIYNQSGGAIGFFGSTTQTSPVSQALFGEALLDQIAKVTASPYRTKRIGDLILSAQLEVPETNATQDVLGSFVYFGDPATKLPASSFSEASSSGATTLNESPSGSSCSAFAGEGKTPKQSFFDFLEWAFWISSLVFIRGLLKKRIRLSSNRAD